MRETKVAVFIDTENLPARCAGEIISIAGGYGRLIERRAYGDFTKEAAQPWIAEAGRQALSLQTAVSSHSGKNGADILLAIDAMEYLAASAIDLFCIASSDRDVGHLAMRIRMRGKQAIGLGAPNASALLRQSFDDFFELNAGEANTAVALPKVIALQPSPNIRPYITQALQAANLQDEGWLDIAELGTLLRRVYPEFKAQHFGAPNLSSLLKRCAFIETQMHGTNRMQIRMKRNG
jgi:hypothetical protein